MDKLEKVIAGLECCGEANKSVDACLAMCPYYGERDGDKVCLDLLQEDALRILKMWDVLHKDLWDRTHEIVRLKKELKAVRAERDAALEKLSWQELSRTPNDWGEYPPEFPKEGM